MILFMKVHVFYSSIDAVDPIVSYDHICHNVIERVVWVTVTAHEHIDGHISMFRPRMDRDMRFSQGNDAGHTLSLIKLMKITMKDLCPSGPCAIFKYVLKKKLIF